MHQTLKRTRQISKLINCFLDELIQPCRVRLERLTKDLNHVQISNSDDKDALSLQLHRERKKQENKCKLRANWCFFCKKIICHLSLGYHMKIRHKNKAIRCKNMKCASYFSTEIERKQHEEQVHIGAKQEKCIYCYRYFAGTENMSHHVKKHHKQAIQCDFSNRPCAKYFTTIAEKDEHVLQVHKTARVIFGSEVKCVYCGKICNNKNCLSGHVAQCHANISWKCRFHGCEFYFLSQSDGDERFCKEHQEKESLKKFQCPKCSYKSADKHGLQAHIKGKHAGDSKLQCHKCPKTFKTENYLKRHLEKAHGERFFCEFCNKDMQKLSLRIHLRKSLCQICNLELPCATVLKLHLKICNPRKD